MLSKQELFDDFINLLNRHVKCNFDNETIILSSYDRQKVTDRIIAFRRRREKLFGQDLFADAAWDIMLDLYRAHLAKKTISVSSACIAAHVPPTTALRWLAVLEERNLIVREADTRDRRRVYVSLSPAAVMSLNGLIGGLVETDKRMSGSLSMAMDR